MKHSGKEHREFFGVDMETGWVPLPTEAGGFTIEEKMLSDSMDEVNKIGSRTRLVRYSPGAYTTRPVIHDFWEEVLVISGDYSVGAGEAEEHFTGFAYACRPPHKWHGPFRTEGGSLLYEIHYYDKMADTDG